MTTEVSPGYLRQVVQDEGWGVRFHSEAIVAMALQRCGFKCRAQVERGDKGQIVETQFRLGPYTLDFALVRERIAIEADGSFHDRRGKHDNWRDRRMAEWGWRTVRIRTDGIELEQAIAMLKELVIELSPLRGVGQ